MLAKKYRLAKKKDIENTAKKGKKAYSPILGIKFIKNDLSYNRYAIIINKKVSNKATKRNRIKRIISEILRLNNKKVKTSFDFVVSAFPKIIKDDKVLSYQEIEKTLLNLLAKNKLS